MTDDRSALPKRPEADPGDRTAHLLKLASKATARALQIRLARHDVAYGHWTFLRILWAEDDLSISELARRAGVAKPAAVNAVHAMERKGYLALSQRAGNQKSVYVKLSDAGRRLEADLVPLAIEVNDIALRGVSPRRRDAFRRVLAQIIANLDTEEE